MAGASRREHGSLGLAHKGLLLSLLQRPEPPEIAFTSWPLIAAHIKVVFLSPFAWTGAKEKKILVA